MPTEPSAVAPDARINWLLGGAPPPQETMIAKDCDKRKVLGGFGATALGSVIPIRELSHSGMDHLPLAVRSSYAEASAVTREFLMLHEY